MSDSVIQDDKASTPEVLVQSAVLSNLAMPMGAQEANMTATIEVRPNGNPDGVLQKGPHEAKTHAVNEVARIAIKDKARVIFVNAIDVIVARAG